MGRDKMVGDSTDAVAGDSPGDTASRTAELERLRAAIIADPANDWAREAGYRPIYSAAPTARIAIIGQAPGRKAQESGIPWDDLSGARLRQWLGVSDAEFYDPELFAILPMDFYFPGKGTSGDLPPRKGIAARWHPPILKLLPELRLTLLIGGYAQKHYLAERAKTTLTETVRAFREYLPEFLPLVHPSPLNVGWRKKNPWFDDEVVGQLRLSVREALDFPRD